MWPQVPFRGELHPRGRGGKFRAKPGELPHPKGRGGKTRTDLPKIKTPEQSRLERAKAVGDRVVAALRGKVPERALLTFYGLWSSYHQHVGSHPMNPLAQDPTAILDWISNAQASLRAVGRALGQSPELLSAILHLVSAEQGEDVELTPEELALLEAHGLLDVAPYLVQVAAVPDRQQERPGL